MQRTLSSVGSRGVIPAGVIAAPEPCALSLVPEPSMAFVVSTEWLASGVPVVSVIGELDLATTPTLEDTLLTLPDNGAEAVIVDLLRCGFIALGGLRVLVAARERLERSNRPLVLVVDNPSMLRVFQITRIDALFEIYPSLAAADGRDDDG